jgi:hypothetical protein
MSRSSCTLCRRRKIRCDRGNPCSNCVRSKNASCVYDNPDPPRQLLRPGERILVAQTSARDRSAASSHVSSAPGKSSSRASTVTSQTSVQEVESLRNRIRELEEQLSKASHATQPSVSTPDSNIETTSSRLSGIFHIHREAGQLKTRSVTHKRRLFGQSHWCNTVILVRNCQFVSRMRCD